MELNKDKQIEEIAKEICPLFETYGECETCDAVLDIGDNPCVHKNIASLIIAHGYRKASEVAREIFVEIDDLLYHDERDYDDLMDSETVAEVYQEYLACSNYIYGIRKAIAELKKKYTEGEE